jgi:hypothetical protein
MECARPMRAGKGSLGHSPWGRSGRKMIGKDGTTYWSPLLVQRAASEGWEGQPGRPPARGTRTIGMCSFDARNRGSTKLPLKREWGIE